MPAVALSTPITLTAIQWMDDPGEPVPQISLPLPSKGTSQHTVGRTFECTHSPPLADDLPLAFNFATVKISSDGTGSTDEQSLGQLSLVSSVVWQRAPAGTFALLCYISDSWMASTRIMMELEVSRAAVRTHTTLATDYALAVSFSYLPHGHLLQPMTVGASTESLPLPTVSQLATSPLLRRAGGASRARRQQDCRAARGHDHKFRRGRRGRRHADCRSNGLCTQ